MTYRLRNIAVAVGLALVAALLTTFYVANYKRHVRQGESTVKVYVAKRDVPQGTSGAEMIKRHLMVTSDVTARTVVPGYVSSPDQVASLLTTQTIFAGEQVTLRRFASHAQQGIRSQLHGTLRALSLPGTNDQLLAGILKDGDHVDVMANLKTAAAAATLLRRPRRRTEPARPASAQHRAGSLEGRHRQLVCGARRQRPPREPEGLLRRAERRRLDAPAAPRRQRDRHAVRHRRATISMLHDDVTPANLQPLRGSGR